MQGAVEARNRDYANIVRSLNFVSKGWYDTQVMSDDDSDPRRKVSLVLLVLTAASAIPPWVLRLFGDDAEECSHHHVMPMALVGLFTCNRKSKSEGGQS